MTWPKPSTEKTTLLESELKRWAATRRSMFGSIAYFTNGNMFAGVFGDSLFMRLSEADWARLRAEHPEAKPFEPVKGRMMREYATVPQGLLDDLPALRIWLRRAFDYANSINPNKKN